MRNRILLSLLLLLFAVPCIAQTGDEEHRITEQEVVVNDTLKLRIREISAQEYEKRKRASAHVRMGYREITDVDQAIKLLGGRLKLIDVVENGIQYDKEITFNDGTKQKYTWEVEFRAYFPGLEVLLFEYESGGDYAIDLNDKSADYVGNPRFWAISPDKQWRINCEGPDICHEGFLYFLEKRNRTTKKHKFVCDLFGDNEFGSGRWFQPVEWVWVNKQTVLYSSEMHHNGEIIHREMKIVTK